MYTHILLTSKSAVAHNGIEENISFTLRHENWTENCFRPLHDNINNNIFVYRVSFIWDLALRMEEAR